MPQLQLLKEPTEKHVISRRNLRGRRSGKKAEILVGECYGVIKVFDIVMKELASQRYISVGKCLYSPKIATPKPIGNGLESWLGCYQSVKPIQMGLSLNIDVLSTAFIEPLPVIDFVSQILGKDVVHSRRLLDTDKNKIKKALTGLKVEVTHRGDVRRKYWIAGLTSQPTKDLVFPVDEERNMTSVVDYFRDMYRFVIQHTQLPCLQVGTPKI